MDTRITEPAPVDPRAREFLRRADPVLARIIDALPDFRPRAWTTDLPALDAFSTLIFEVIGQQLSVRATRTILGGWCQTARHHPTTIG
jgi:3-methyladenine DNA glycosylase/8-oxoguanine DNA glycosylase